MPDESRLPERNLAGQPQQQAQTQGHHEAGAHEGEDREVVGVTQIRRDGHHNHGEDQ